MRTANKMVGAPSGGGKRVERYLNNFVSRVGILHAFLSSSHSLRKICITYYVISSKCLQIIFLHS